MPEAFLLPELVRPNMQAALEGVRPERVQWFEVHNAVDTTGDGTPDTTEVVIYDEIGGWCGVSPAAFRAAMNEITTPNIDLRVHSPGGNAFDGIAIYNTIRQHPAHTVAYVDGLAASAASFIALAADEVVMSEAAQLMIHDAWGMVVGPASDMTDVAAQLNKMSDNIAGLYARKAGGTVAEWRAAMQSESWYTDHEAVAAGLADRVAEDKKATPVSASWNLSVFMYGGRNAAVAPDREAAPEPPMPAGRKFAAGGLIGFDAPPTVASASAARETVKITASNVADPPVTPKITPAAAAARMHSAPVANRANGPTNNGKGSAMDPVMLRTALGLPADATDETVRGALAADGLASAPTPTELADTADPVALSALAEQTGAVLVDSTLLRELRTSAMKGEQAYDAMRRSERDGVLNQAVKDGKFPVSALDSWAKLWDADPEGTRRAVNNLARNVIPVMTAGYAATMDDISEADMAYNGLYGAPVEGR
jgi:ATP-dependent protease ClpP protease subunit